MLLISLLTYTFPVPTFQKIILILRNTIIISFKRLWYKSCTSSLSNYSPPSLSFFLAKYKYTPNVPLLKVLNARSNHVIDQILHTNELTFIFRAIAAASSSFLEFVFGSNQLHAGTIVTLPEGGIKVQCLLHSYTADKCKI